MNIILFIHIIIVICSSQSLLFYLYQAIHLSDSLTTAPNTVSMNTPVGIVVFMASFNDINIMPYYLIVILTPTNL